MKRRTFITGALAAGALGSLGSVAYASNTAQALDAAGPPMTFNQPELTQGEPLTVPALVIGSGYGGAVAALRLTEAGIPTTVLEMGFLWERALPGYDSIFCKMTSPDKRSMWYRGETDMPVSTFFFLQVVNKNIDKWAGVLDKSNFANISIYRGIAVGGGSVVNGGIAVRAPRDVLDRRFWPALTTELYEHWYDVAEKTLGVNSPPANVLDSDCYHFSSVSKGSAKDAGFNVRDVNNVYDFEYMSDELNGKAWPSGTDGQVIFGNDAGKRSLDKTYLAEAHLTGLLFVKERTRAQRIRKDGDHWIVETHSWDRNDNSIAQQSFRTPRLFLAAGVIGTMELLLTARQQGEMPNLNDSLGKNWGPNGNMMVARWNWVGTGSWQSAIPLQAIDHWAEGGVLAEIAPMPANFELMLSLYLAIGDSNQSANFGLDNNGNLNLDWRSDQHTESESKIWPVFDAINATAFTNYRVDLFGNGLGGTSAFTYHPLGGAVLNKTVDEFGRIAEYPNVYVVDGSTVPIGVGVNPFLTITAVAERSMANIIAQDFPFGPSAAFNPKYDFTIASNDRKLAVDLKDEGTPSPGQQVTSWWKTDAPSQRFRLVPQASDSQVKVMAASNPGKPLYWAVQNDGSVSLDTRGSVFTIASRGGGYTLSPDNGKTFVSFSPTESKLVVSPTASDSIQVLRLTRPTWNAFITPDASAYPQGKCRIVCNATGMVLDNLGDYKHEGNRVGSWEDKNAENQAWDVTREGDKFFFTSNSGFILAGRTNNGLIIPGAEVRIVPRDSTYPGFAKNFNVKFVAKDQFMIVHQETGLVVTARRGSMPLNLEYGLGLQNQIWTWRPA